MNTEMTRRVFLAQAGAAGTLTAGASAPGAKILNYNSKMEYRRLGRTGLMVSAVCLGGHWKRVGTALSRPFSGLGYAKEDFDNLNAADFMNNRHQIVSRCIEVGINYIDACAGPEVLAYSRVLKGRRDKMYLGYSWDTKESRYRDWRTAKKLMQGLDEGLREAKLDYVDLWRITLLANDGVPVGLEEILQVENGAIAALEMAKEQGKARFTGVSTHDRIWLKKMIEQYPNQLDVVLFPYTADTKELPDDSVFDAINKIDVGMFGIKPFANNSLFQGDSSPNSPHAEEDDRRARLAIRYILGNPAITAPIPGLVSVHQVDNVARAVMERRKLDLKERTELEKAGDEMWAKLPPDHAWLREWEYV